jgi:GTP-binding protein
MRDIEKLFSSQCEFKMGAQNYAQIPDSRLPEVAFIGKSNVGKSSLINALVNRRIAITSKTPGRTRQLNFFVLDGKLSLVDMPGYGYAKVGKREIDSWEKLSYKYFSTRANLKRVFLLIDSRKGITEQDKEMANIFNAVALSFQIVLTKTDELKPEGLDKMREETRTISKKFPALHPEIIATSSVYKTGIDQLRESIMGVI